MKKINFLLLTLFSTLLFFPLYAKQAPSHQIETSYSRFDGGNDFSENVWKSKAKFTLGNLAGIRWTSETQVSYSQSDSRQDFLYPEKHYSFSQMFSGMSQKLWLLAGAASASDSLFHSEEASSFYAGAFYSVYASQNSRFYLGGFYVNQEIIAGLPEVPIPFFAYQYFSKNFIFMIGPVTSIQWNLLPRLSFKFNYGLIMGNDELSIQWKIFNGLSITGKFRMYSSSFYPEGRKIKEEALTVSGNEAGLEIKENFSSFFSLSVYGGYQFGGKYGYREPSALGESNSYRVKKDLPDGPVFRIRTQISF